MYVCVYIYIYIYINVLFKSSRNILKEYAKSLLFKEKGLIAIPLSITMLFNKAIPQNNIIKDFA